MNYAMICRVKDSCCICKDKFKNQPDRVLSYFQMEWKVLLIVTVLGLKKNDAGCSIMWSRVFTWYREQSETRLPCLINELQNVRFGKQQNFCRNGKNNSIIKERLIINRQSCMIINEYFVLKWQHITSRKGTWVWQTLMRKN